MGRSLLLCAEDTPAAQAAAEFLVRQVYREGDTVHLAYVVKALKPPMEVFHAAGPGSSYNFAAPGSHRELEVIAAAKRAIEARYLPVLREKMCPYQLHLFADRDDAPPAAVGGTILKCAAEQKADLVLLASHNRPHERDRWEGSVGSVAKYVMAHCKAPLAVVPPPA